MRRATLLFLILVAAHVGCSGGDEPKTYTVRGQVTKVLDEGKSLVVNHEAVPGYMGAMQMSLTVADPAQARDLKSGDKVRFTLHVPERGVYIDAIERLPADTPLELASSPH